MGSPFSLASIIFGYLFVSFFVIAALYLCRPKLSFFKSGNGRIKLFSWLLFSPYFLLARLSLLLHSKITKESSINKIQDKLYLGRFHWSFEVDELDRINTVAVLDLTWEFSAPQKMVNNRAYLNVAVLDGAAPTIAQLQEATAWLSKQVKNGSVFIHCALGHSRSAMTLAAYLLKMNQLLSPDEAINLIVSIRKSVKLNDEQYSALQAYAQGNL